MEEDYSKNIIEIVNEAGETLSYAEALEKLKKLEEKRKKLFKESAKSEPYTERYDNYNSY